MDEIKWLYWEGRVGKEHELVIRASSARRCEGRLNESVHARDKVSAVSRLDRRNDLKDVLRPDVLVALGLRLAVHERTIVHALDARLKETIPDFFIVDLLIDHEQEKNL